MRKIFSGCLVVIGVVFCGLLSVAAGAGIFVAHQSKDVRMPLDAAVTALVTNFMYSTLPDLDTPAKEDYLVGDEPGSNYWGVRGNSDWLLHRTIQLVPYYQDLGITKNSVYPLSVIFAPQTEFDAFHLGGFAVCDPRAQQFGLVVINIRYTDPKDDWAKGGDLLGTFAHELGHIEGVCGDDEKMEAANQLEMYEVLASVFNHGDKTALRPLMYELRTASVGYLKSWAYRNNIAPEFEFFEDHFIKSSAYDQARKRSNMLDWPPNWQEVRNLYDAQPFIFMWEGLQNKDQWTNDLPLGYLHGGAAPFHKAPSDYFKIRLFNLNYLFNHMFESWLRGLVK